MQVTRIGFDIAKSVFQVHGVDEHGKVVVRKQLTRRKVLPYFAQLPACRVGMEACGSAHSWGRELQKLGHDVRLMAVQLLKPYRTKPKHDRNDAEAMCEAVSRPQMRFVPIKTVEQQAVLTVHRARELLVSERTGGANQTKQKNDRNDAEAICEAVSRPQMRFVPIKTVEQQAVLTVHRARELLVSERTGGANQTKQKNDRNDAEAICEAVSRPQMRFVPIKTVEQQAVLTVHRARELLVSERTAVANQIRGLLLEYGVAIAPGIQRLRRELPAVLSAENEGVPTLARTVVTELQARLLE